MPYGHLLVNSNVTTQKEIKMIFKTLLDKLEVLSKVTGIIAAIFAILAVLLPAFLWRQIEAKIASIYGTSGWVYYEVGKNREITNDGNFYLLKESETGFYSEINIGDKLRVSGDINFRNGPTNSAPRSFVLITGDCVIVTNEPAHKVEVQEAKSGGWLNVATSPCGLF